MTRLTRTRRYLLLKHVAKRIVPGQHAWHGPLDDGDLVAAVDPVVMDWPAGVPKPVVGLVKDVDDYPYWTKYRHFLEANQIPFELYDIHRSGLAEGGRQVRLRRLAADVLPQRARGVPAQGLPPRAGAGDALLSESP